MSFSSDNGYTALSVQAMMLAVMNGVNAQFGTTYTEETFLGTGFYKFYYSLVQELQKNEVKCSEIFLKLQQYLALTNERISRPVVTNPGLVEILESNGFIASVKKPVNADAGKVFVCVDTDPLAVNYAAKKLQINTIIKDSTVAGVVSQGTETSSITLSNGQSFDFKFTLPTRYLVKLKLTITLSENNQVFVKSPDEVKDILLDNIAARYRLGRNFEPQRYFSVLDAPWASHVLLEWSIDNGVNYSSGVFDSNYDQLFDVKLQNITVIEVS